MARPPRLSPALSQWDRDHFGRVGDGNEARIGEGNVNAP